MKKTLITIILAFAALLCRAERYYFVQSLLRPAAVTFPADVQNVLVVNNAPLQNPNSGHWINGEKTTLTADSTAIYCTWGMTEALNETGFFESVSLLDATQHSNPALYSSIKPLGQARVDSLCERYGADALVVLNSIIEKDYRSRQLAYPDEYDPTVHCYCSMDVLTATQWTVCYPHSGSQTAVNGNDSLYWQAEGLGNTPSQIAETERQLTDISDAVHNAALNAGMRAAKQLVPQWDEEDRYLFDDQKKRFAEGIQLVRHRLWQEAIGAWQPLLDNKKALVRAYAYANTAVCLEMDNDLEQAKAHAEKALLLLEDLSGSSADMAYSIVSNYIRQLERIIKEDKIVKAQLGTE